MQTFIDFLVNNYLWFLIVSLILVFALIGYLVDTNEKKDKKTKEENIEEHLPDDAVNLEQDVEVLDDEKNS